MIYGLILRNDDILRKDIASVADADVPVRTEILCPSESWVCSEWLEFDDSAETVCKN